MSSDGFSIDDFFGGSDDVDQDFNIGDLGGGNSGSGQDFDFGGDLGDFGNDFGGGLSSGDIFFDSQTGTFVTFDDIARSDPQAAFQLDPQKYFNYLSQNSGSDNPQDKLGPQTPNSLQKFLDAIGSRTSSVTNSPGGKGLAQLAPFVSTLSGAGLALGGLLSGGGTLRNPSTDPRARQLLDLVQNQTQIQQKLINDTLKGSAYGNEEALRAAGLKQLLDQVNNPNGVQDLFSGDDEVRKAANKQLLDAINREGQASPQLLRQLGEQEQQLNQSFLNSLGPGYVTSTPYLQAKADFDQRKVEAIANDSLVNRGQEISLLSGISLPRSQFLQDTSNQNFARNLTTAGATPTTDALLKVLQAQGAPIQGAAVGLNAYQNQANNLLSANMFNLDQGNKNRNALLSGGGQLLGLGLYGVGRRNASTGGLY